MVKVFGEARPYEAYLFANHRANRLKILIHDRIGIWLAVRRLHQDHFIWPRERSAPLSSDPGPVRVLGIEAALAAP